MYIAKRKRGMLIGSCMYLAITVLLVYLGYSNNNYGLFVGLIFLVMAWKTYTNISPWVLSSSKLSYCIDNDHLVTVGESFEYKLSISMIKKVVVQTRKDKILSILLHSKEGGLEKLEGIDNIEGFVTDMTNSLGKENVKYARFFHR